MLQVIYIARNPKDVCVSAYHFFKTIAGYMFSGDFPAFFEVFKTGRGK